MALPADAFPPVTPDQWRQRAGDQAGDGVLSTQDDRPADVPLGARVARGWLRLAAVDDPGAGAAEALAQGSEGLSMVWSPGLFEGLCDLDPAAPVVLESQGEGTAPLDGFEGRAGILYAGFDPLAALARDGQVSGGLSGALARVPEVVRAGETRHGSGRALRVDAGPWHRAGADIPTELAAAVTNLAEVLRAGEADGLDPVQVASQTVIAFEVGGDLLEELAKLRAARLLIERLLAACGATSPTPPWIHATTSWVTLTRRDPMTNALRATTQAFAAALGGADAITVRAFDAAASEPGPLGARLARNTQTILALESHLARVADPAGGSYHLERRTDQLARAAWERVREIEGRGGAAACLLDGWWHSELAASWDATRARLEGGDEQVLGVNLHPGEQVLDGKDAAPATGGEIEPFPVHRRAAVFEGEAP